MKPAVPVSKLPTAIEWNCCSILPAPPDNGSQFWPTKCLVAVQHKSGAVEIEGPAEKCFYIPDWRMSSGGRVLEQKGARVIAWALWPEVKTP